MRPKIYISYFLLTVFLNFFGISDLAAQSGNQKIEETAFLLSRTSEIPELGPVEIEPIEAPGRAIAEDRNGFMWFGGIGGLYRYDGNEYVHYKHNPNDSASLSHSIVESLYIGSDDMIWIGTHGDGLSRLDPVTNTVTRFLHDESKLTSLGNDIVTSILEDSHGNLWIGTHGGLNLFDKATETFTRYLHDPDDPNSLSNNQVRALYEDSDGTLWVGTGSPSSSETPVGEGGLNRFHPESLTFTRYFHIPDDSSSLINNKVMSIYEDSRGTFWVGTIGDGLHSMNRETGSFTRHLFDPNDRAKLSRPFFDSYTAVPDDCIDFDCGGVTFIHEDHKGFLWIGAILGGINRYDLHTGAMSHYEARNSGLLSNLIWSVHESYDGTLWVGTWNGMHRVFASTNFFPLLTTQYENFRARNVGALHEDADHRIWIKYGWVLAVLNRNTGTATLYQYRENDPKSLLSYQVNGSTIDPAGNLWIAYPNGGLSRYNRTEDNFEHFFSDPENIRRRSGTSVFVDRNDQMWSNDAWGLYHIDPDEEIIIKNYTSNPNDPTTLSDNRVTVIRDTHDGKLWAGTRNGLNLIDRCQTDSSSRNDIQRFLQGRHITSIFEDTEDRLWIGTWGDGFHLLDRSTGQSQNYDTNDGLPSNYVASIIEDEHGFLWISTTEGQYALRVRGIITRFNPETESFISFGTQEGLPNIGFTPGTALKTHDGLLLFGGLGGCTFFDPSVIRYPAYRSPKISLTGLRIYNDATTPANGDVLNRAAYLEDSIELSYQQNDFTFDYKAFAYSTPDQIQYQYQLEPYDSDWVSARSQRSARYSRIPPGEYRFRVRTIDSRGVYSEEEAGMDILILPPWWRTWWAYSLYALLIIAGIFEVNRFQRRRLITKEREKARERELEQEKAHTLELEEAYSKLEDSLNKLTAAQDQLVQQKKLASLGQFTAGIAHEIKNPLNFVNNFSALSVELLQEIRDEVKRVRAYHDTPLPNNALDEISDLIDDIEANLETIQKHGTHADGIVKSMLQHSHGGDGKMEPTPLNPLIKEYVNLAFHEMGVSKNPINVNIDLQLDENVGEVPLFARDFSRVILNLCNNAFDAMKEKMTRGEGPGTGDSYDPKLTIRSKPQNGKVIIEIENNGPDIPEEIKDKILQPFFTTKKGTAGAGLGLSITNDIIKAHGGSIEINSAEGATIFSITLPDASSA